MMLADSIVTPACARAASPLPPSSPSIKAALRLPIAACLLSLLTACGGDSVSDIVTVVGSDSAQASDPFGINDGQDNGDDTGADADGDSGNGSDPDSDTGSNNDNGNNEPQIANGTAAVPDLNARPVSVIFDCKIQGFDGRAVLEAHELRYDPATVGFFFDDARIFNTGFNWVSASREYSAERATRVGTATIEYFAKVDAMNQPTYYRYKLTRADFSYEQIECYSGLVL